MSDDRDSGLIDTFLALGPDSKDCFRMFGRSGSAAGCYVLGWWATFVAKEYIRSAAVLRSWGNPQSPVPVVVVNDNMCKEIIRDCLLRRGATVEYYERPAGGGAYKCMQRGTPGNISDFEASLFEFEEAEIQLLATGAVVLAPVTGGGGGGGASQDGGVLVGFAALNSTLRQLSYAEYRDTAQLASLDALVAQSNLKELTLCTSGERESQRTASQAEAEEERLRVVRRLCERGGVTLHIASTRALRQRQRDAAGATLETLQELLRVPEGRLALADCPLASRALEHVLAGVDPMDAANRSALHLRRVVPSAYMLLDSGALEALNLVSKKPEPRGSLPQSVFSWLNRCRTGMGSRAMRQWLTQPLRHVEEIHQRQRMVEILVESPMLRDMLLQRVLRRCGDMDRLNRRLQRRRLPLKDTQALLHFINVVPDAIQVLRTYQGQDTKLIADEYIAPLEDINEYIANLRTLIEATVDFSDRNMVRINPTFDDELQTLHGQLLEVQRDIDKEYSRVLKRYEWSEKTLKYECHASYGYVFRVPRREDRPLRTNKELITVSTAKDGVRFVSEALAALSERYNRISADYDARQQDLKTKLVDTIASYLPVLDDTKELIASLDVFVAWAVVVVESPRPMVRPTVRPGDDEADGVPILSMKSVRHPLVELRQPNYVANSVHLTHGANGLLITGPNMGGKSTFMRSVGVAAVMAQAGCFVCADAAELQVRDALMCRVGATDHLAQGVSTFMVEMLESAAILSGASRQTLAIVDELGRGTSTYDGFGLAWAIAKEVAVGLRAALLFSTHFHELTQLAADSPCVHNAHFGADVDEAAGTLRFSYSLAPGPCSRSYGLYVAALADLPAEVVAAAKRKAAELETFEGSGTAAAVKLEADVAARLGDYAARVRELEAVAARGEADAASMAQSRKRLREEIAADVAMQPLLAR